MLTSVIVASMLLILSHVGRSDRTSMKWHVLKLFTRISSIVFQHTVSCLTAAIKAVYGFFCSRPVGWCRDTPGKQTASDAAVSQLLGVPFSLLMNRFAGLNDWYRWTVHCGQERCSKWQPVLKFNYFQSIFLRGDLRWLTLTWRALITGIMYWCGNCEVDRQAFRLSKSVSINLGQT